jgi:predicted O-methyltransferase YrrM
MKMLQRLFAQRPRILNVLHSVYLAAPSSQTTLQERLALAEFATSACIAVEIGTYQGVSSVHIANAMRPAGTLWCVDPWPESAGMPNECLSICARHFRRSGLTERIKVIRAFSCDAGGLLPMEVDFAFIDGDHSWSGVDTDWKLIAPRIRKNGFVCLHDSVVPVQEPWRSHDSTRYFKEVISNDSQFELVRIVHSLAILRRV